MLNRLSGDKHLISRHLFFLPAYSPERFSLQMKRIGTDKIESFDCVYCGLTAGARDHVRPHSYDSDGSIPRTFTIKEIVPACKECNSLLSNIFLPTIAERADYISMKLQFKYKKELNMPAWSQSELEELGPEMRAFVKKNIHKKAVIRARIEIALSMAKNTKLTPVSYWESKGCDTSDNSDSWKYLEPGSNEWAEARYKKSQTWETPSGGVTRIWRDSKDAADADNRSALAKER